MQVLPSQAVMEALNNLIAVLDDEGKVLNSYTIDGQETVVMELESEDIIVSYLA